MLDYREPAFGCMALPTVAIHHAEYNSAQEGRFVMLNLSALKNSLPDHKLLLKWSHFINSGHPS